jgi:hypothetical protein
MANDKPTPPKPAAPAPETPSEAVPKPGKPGAERARLMQAIDQPAPKEGEPSGYHPPVPPFMSQGVKNDLEQYGETTDPSTGRRLTRADLD